MPKAFSATKESEVSETKTGWILARLREPSTWKGLSVFAGAMGIGLAPELLNQIGLIVVAVVGLVDMVRKES